MKTTTVALIEDHTLVRELLGGVLRSAPELRVVGDFATVADSIEGCRRLKPALVIIDWILPDGNGMAVRRALAAELPQTRYIFLSSLEREHVVRDAVEAGVHGFLMKRVSCSVLLEAVRTVIAGHSYYCPVSSRLLVEALRGADVDRARKLTPRERDILRGVAQGESIKAIASRLGLNPRTTANQFTALKDKLGLHESAGLVRYAIQHGIVDEI